MACSLPPMIPPNYGRRRKKGADHVETPHRKNASDLSAAKLRDLAKAPRKASQAITAVEER